MLWKALVVSGLSSISCRAVVGSFPSTRRMICLGNVLRSLKRFRKIGISTSVGTTKGQLVLVVVEIFLNGIFLK